MKPRPMIHFSRTQLACAATLAALTLSACTVGPAYKRPDVAAPASFKEVNNFDGSAWKTATPGDQLPRGPWWERFQDADPDERERMLVSDEAGHKKKRRRRRTKKRAGEGAPGGDEGGGEAP